MLGRTTRKSMGLDYAHSAVDDHTRLAYSENHADEKVATCAGFLHRAVAFFTAHGIDRIERVLTDNAGPFRKSFAWRDALTDLGAVGKLTRGGMRGEVIQEALERPRFCQRVSGAEH